MTPENQQLITLSSSFSNPPVDNQTARRKVQIRIKLRAAKRKNLSEDAVSYRVPMEVTRILVLSEKMHFPVCPRCETSVEREYMKYCDRCGQKLGWSKLKDAIIVYPGFSRSNR